MEIRFQEMEVYRPENAFGMNLRTFKIFGVWPSAIKHPVLRFFHELYGYAIHFFYIGILLPAQFTSMYIMRNNVQELVDSSFFTLSCIAYASKFVVFILRRKKVEGFFQRLHDPIFAPRRKEHLDVLEESAVTARTSSVTLLSIAMTTCITWIIFPLVENREEKTLLFAAWFPYNTTVNPAYGYTYVSQTLLLLTTAAMDTMIDMMTTNFFVLMVGQIEILKLDFRELTDFIVINHSENETIEFSKENLVNCENSNKNSKGLSSSCELTTKIPYDVYLKSTSLVKDVFYCNEQSLDKILNDRVINCTLRYEAITKFVTDVTNFFQIGIVTQFCVTSIIFCTTTYEMTSISPATLQFYMLLQYQLCILYQIFVFAWRGNSITIKTEELRDAVYECEWTSVPNLKFRKSLCIIMSQLQVPITLRVGKFFLLSVDTYLKIIKMAYTFYVLLKQVNAKKELMDQK